MATNTAPLTVSVGTLPPGYAPDGWQALLEAFGARLVITGDTGINVFESSAAPTSDQGLWLNTVNGTLNYFDDTTGSYQPLVVPQERLKYILSTTAPDPAVYLLWFVQSSTTGYVTDIRSYQVSSGWQSIYYTKTEIDNSFSGKTAGKYDVNWTNVTSKPVLYIAPDSSGNTAGRPAAPANNQMYFDSDINTMLIFNRGAWRTLDGTPGDLKWVDRCFEAGSPVAVPTIGQVLTANPGWEEASEYAGRFIICRDGTYAFNTTGGEATVVLTEPNIPQHFHELQIRVNASINGGGSIATSGLMIGDTPGANSTAGPPITDSKTGLTGSGSAHNNIPPYRAAYLLRKT
jgi:hypothetical protein